MQRGRKPSARTVKHALRDIQHDILEATAQSRSLTAIMDLLCRRVEALDDGIICSVLAVDASGRLRPLAAPKLPAAYSSAIDGLPIGPKTGSCGTAAFRGEPVIVTDIATDPLWEDYRALALPLGLRACWSSPIKSRDGRVIGTFAFYRGTPGGPGEVERAAVSTCTHLCTIAIEHDEARARIHELAYFDPTTRLPNRARFQELLADALAHRAEGTSFAVHILDIDEFKDVNDALGHHVGDALLRAVATRIALIVGVDGVVARLGGDEFAVLQPAADGIGSVCALAERVLAVFAEPFQLDHHTLSAGACIGIAVASGLECDGESLTKEADLALHRAKQDGGDTYRLFDPQMLACLLARRSIEQDLTDADFDRDFDLAYQPIVDFRSKRIVGAEALLRWKHPQKGHIAPGIFIPVAEQAGLMPKLGDWVLARACRDGLHWPVDLRIGVNLSPVQLKRPGFARDVLRTIGRIGLAPDRLTFEITETALLGDATAARSVLSDFGAAGIGIALDDFGTGYSSLSHLRAFPIDVIKIDRSFVTGYGTDREATAIVDAIIGLARELGMRTVAEGIETPEQFARLDRSGCTMGQGYYLGRPQSRVDFQALLARNGAARHRPLAQGEGRARRSTIR
jgi:diguanylate cyclase (GGDEF)-like protein